MVSLMFKGIIGQSAAIEYLQRAISTQRIAPAYLFAGPEGIGRSRVAEQFLSLLLDPKQTEQRSLKTIPIAYGLPRPISIRTN